ncbi:MAG: hypothetical protein IPJ88_15115 [Myxococcales bacterium]|nr:MAG: hypothetical protein IPJ88_15115 [Myxococcales bacterium]
MAYELKQQHIIVGIVGLTFVLSAMLFAHGCTRIIATSTLSLDPELQQTQSGGALPQFSARGAIGSAASKRRDPKPLLKRNIFDSALGPLDQIPAPEATDGGPLVVDPNAPPPPCEGGIRLVGSFAFPKLPEYSFAAIATSSQTGMLFRSGMSVDGNIVADIYPDLVFLRRSGGGLCTLSMFGQEAMVRPPKASTASTATTTDKAGAIKTRTGFGVDEISENIEKISDTSYNINRSLVTKLLEDQSAMMRAARIRPVKEGDRVIGVKLSAIRKTGLLGQLGLSNGDVLRTINGYDMSDPSAALQAYARLRNENSLTVSVLRDGKPVNMTYNIR